MHTLLDEDGNNWNVELKIEDGKLMAYNTSDLGAESYEINLDNDMIDIQLRG